MDSAEYINHTLDAAHRYGIYKTVAPNTGPAPVIVEHHYHSYSPWTNDFLWFYLCCGPRGGGCGAPRDGKEAGAMLAAAAVVVAAGAIFIELINTFRALGDAIKASRNASRQVNLRIVRAEVENARAVWRGIARERTFSAMTHGIITAGTAMAMSALIIYLASNQIVFNGGLLAAGGGTIAFGIGAYILKGALVDLEREKRLCRDLLPTVIRV